MHRSSRRDREAAPQAASVVGRTFLYRILARLAGEVRTLDQDLGRLRESELIRERRQLPDMEYAFKHAVTQEVGYETILLQRRRELHRQVAVCIETLFADRLDEFYGVLAHHYASAEAWDKAQEYLLRAGDQAGAVAADAEALEHYRQAIEAYEQLSGDHWTALERGGLDRKIGEALFRSGDYERAISLLQSALRRFGRPSLPDSRWGIRAQIARQALEQAWHRVRGRTRRHRVSGQPSHVFVTSIA